MIRRRISHDYEDRFGEIHVVEQVDKQNPDLLTVVEPDHTIDDGNN